MARDVWEYFEQRKDECERYGLGHLSEPEFVEKAGTDRKQGRIVLRLRLTDAASVNVTERVIVNGDSIHRESYGYYLIYNGQEYLARDRDSVHGDHGHEGSDHRRIDADRITFKDFIQLAWEVVEQEEELAGAES